MKRNKVLLLCTSLGTLALLVWAATEENILADWNQIQREYVDRLPAEEASNFPVQLRQVVVPALQVTDRCISCHVGMAPGESAVEGHPAFSAHPDVVHDPAEFGCTVCHGGQGRATAREDAHGRVPFWPEPMIPLEMADAGCGACHTHLSVPDTSQLARGRRLFERHDCFACHAVDGRGGTLRPFGAAGVTAPDLSLVGARGYDRNWYGDHVSRRATESAAWGELFPSLEEEEQKAIGVYLSSRVGAPDLIEAKAVFHALGCRGCHPVHGVGGVDGPALDVVGQKDPGRLDFSHVPGENRALHAWFAEHFRAPAKVVQGSQMPYLGLSEESIEKLTLYMLSLRQSAFPEAYWPKDRIRAEFMEEREFATDGKTLYRTFCAACHGDEGQGMRYPGMAVFPAISNPDFLSLASDEFLFENIRRGRPGRKMPAWREEEGGLRREEIERLVDYIRELGGGLRPSEDQDFSRMKGDTELGRELYAANCGQCHGREGRGGEGPSLANPVFLETASDTYIVETILRGRRGTTMPAFRTSSPVHRRLTEEEVESVLTFIRTWENEP